MKKRLLSTLLALCMVSALLPVQALAVEPAEPVSPTVAAAEDASEAPQGWADTEEDAILSSASLQPQANRVLAAGFTDTGEPVDWNEADEVDGSGIAPAALMVLDTPTELEWGRSYHSFIKPEDEPDGYAAFPGMFSWKLGSLRQYHYEVCIYQKTPGGDVLIDKTSRWYGGDQGGNVEWNGSRRDSCFRFLLEDRESGDYYFTVQALGDGNGYTNSAVAVSDVWHYEHPAERIQTPSKPVFDEENQHFTWFAEDSEFACRSYKKFFYAPDLSTDPVEVGGLVSLSKPGGNNGRPSDQMLEEYGSGYYSIQVFTISRDIERMANSDWSERSEPAYFTANSSTLSNIVNGVDAASPDAEKRAAIEQVRAMDQKILAELIAADTDNSGAAGDIKRLEELAGTRASVVVSDEIEFDKGQISIIGAGLNVDVGQSITLNVDKPDEGAIIPTMYGNTLQFSMGLTDGDGNDVGSGQLAVPVKITLPLPGYINPDFLVILHHHQNGSYEEVFLPYVYEDQGQWYATFMVRSFSTFTLAECRCAAEQTPTGVLTSVLLDEGETADKVFCALYDKNGKMLGIQTVPKGKRTELRFSCETSAGDHVKVLFLDNALCPTEPAWYMDVEKG